MNTLLRRIATPAVVGTGLAVVLGAGVASAYFGSGVAASGTGTATPATPGPLAFDVVGSVGTGLYPGGPGANLTLSVVNPYDQDITIESLVVTGTVTAAPVSCANPALTISATGLPMTVAADSVGNLVLSGVVTMGLSADSACQGATFSIPLKVTGRL